MSILPISLFSQQPSYCDDPKFENKVGSLLSFTVPVISVDDLQEIQSSKEVLLLDARELEEYDISHIPSAKCIGYDKPDFDVLKGVDKDQAIIVYCSVGYRSEKIGEKLQKKGYTKVFNLYGSLFEWANKGLPVVNTKGDTVKQVHTYNRNWSQWVSHPELEKMW